VGHHTVVPFFQRPGWFAFFHLQVPPMIFPLLSSREARQPPFFPFGEPGLFPPASHSPCCPSADISQVRCFTPDTPPPPPPKSSFFFFFFFAAINLQYLPNARGNDFAPTCLTAGLTFLFGTSCPPWFFFFGHFFFLNSIAECDPFLIFSDTNKVSLPRRSPF